MISPLSELEAHYRARDLAARAWKARGGRVVGYVGETVPVEMIAAAGFLPYRLSGDSSAPFTHLGKYYYPFADKSVPGSRVMSLEFVNSMLDKLLAGAYDFLDYLVIPNTRKAILSMHAHLEAARAYAGLVLPELFILDRTITTSYVSSEYNRARIFEFGNALERWSGKTLEHDVLARSIADYNHNRVLLRQLGQLRTASGPRLSGVAALHAYGAGKFMPVEDHNAILERLLSQGESLGMRAGARVFVAGSPQDDTRLYECIEAEGATVVSENHAWGVRCIGRTVQTDIAPMEALADAYHKTPGCTTFPLAESVRRCSERALDAKATCAVFYVHRHDDAQVFDTPDERAALAGAGIESVYLAEQPYRFEYTERERAQLRELIERSDSAFASPLST